MRSAISHKSGLIDLSADGAALFARVNSDDPQGVAFEQVIVFDCVTCK
jgi:hypothetical protein